MTSTRPALAGRRPALLDVLLAIGVAIAVLVGTYAAGSGDGAASHLRHLGPGGYLLAGLGALFLAFRNTAPTATLAATSVFALAYEASSYPGGPAPLPVVLALFTLAVHGHRLQSLGLGLAAIVLLLAVRGLVVGDSFTSPLFVVLPTTIVAALFAGQLSHALQTRRTDREQRTQLAEREREQDTRRQVDAERLRIARELHDVVAHNISLINVQATMGVHLMHTQPDEAAAALTAIKAASKQALRELRQILDVLRAPDDDEPTGPAPGLDQLDALVRAAQQAGLPVELTVTGTPHPVPATIDVAAYRIVQESLTNALRYAAGSRTRVHLDYTDTCLSLRVHDDGGTPHAGATTAGSGHGIAGMRERAAAVGGTLTARPASPGGFTVTADLPFTGATA
jgi:signal transduction histidine kinase